MASLSFVGTMVGSMNQAFEASLVGVEMLVDGKFNINLSFSGSLW